MCFVRISTRIEVKGIKQVMTKVLPMHTHHHTAGSIPRSHENAMQKNSIP